MKIALLISCAVLSGTIAQAATVKSEHPHSIDVTNMDLKAKPGTNFFEFACGGWNKKHPMPAEESRYGIFNKLIDDNNARVRTLIEDMAKNKKTNEGSLEQKIGTLYNKVIDSKTLNKEGIQPLMKYLQPFNLVKSRQDIMDLAAKMGHYGISSFFVYYAEADAKDSKMNLVQIGQGGLTLGERDYYLDTDSATLAIRNAYREFGCKVFAKLYPNASQEEVKKKMNDVIRIETALAQSFKSKTALRIPENNYNKINYEALKQSYPAISWDRFFKLNNFPAFSEVNVGQPEAMTEANNLLANEDIEALKNYLIFRMTEESMSYLSDDLRLLHFDFFGKTMSGTEKEKPAWKRGVNLTNGLLGEAIGHVYVNKYFPEAAKQKMETLVKNLQTALAERIKAQEWMGAETKQKALDKLATFYIKIGFPNKWRDYSTLKVDKTKSLLDLVMDVSLFNNDYETAQTVNKPVDKDKWYMNPHEVNAYYNPPTNEICFPAGILQYPFFDMNANDAFNYGAIGVVIGHEMTHGFDDQGRKFDKDGNMKEWWSPEDAKRFAQRTQVMVDFYNNIKVLPDLNANGQLTLGENLADHGGLQVAYAAFKNATKGEKQPSVGGFTPDQQFYLAFAGVWSGNIRTAEIRKRVKSDPHSLGEWRVNGQLPHIDNWYKAFNITPKDPMYLPKEKRVTIW